jgi:hypothetical protein
VWVLERYDQSGCWVEVIDVTISMRDGWTMILWGRRLLVEARVTMPIWQRILTDGVPLY